MANRVCMVGSDEEDEDGNLSEIGSKSRKSTNSEILPRGEVVYLSEDNSRFQPEEEEITDRPIPVVYVNTNSDGEEDSDNKANVKKNLRRSSRRPARKPFYDEVEEGNDTEHNVTLLTSIKTENKNVNTKNTLRPSVSQSIQNNPNTQKLSGSKPIQTAEPIQKKIQPIQPKPIEKKDSEKEKVAQNEKNIQDSTAKATALMPPPMKRGNSFDHSGNRKAKYARQATPICDAIMKEYSKRQKLLKGQGSSGPPDLSDLPIQELLKKAQMKAAENESRNKTNNDLTKKPEYVEKITTHLNKTSEERPTKIKEVIVESSLDNISEESSLEKQIDPLLPTVKQEIIDVKPVLPNTATKLLDIKPVIAELPGNTGSLPHSSPGNKLQNTTEPVNTESTKRRGRPVKIMTVNPDDSFKPSVELQRLKLSEIESITRPKVFENPTIESVDVKPFIAELEQNKLDVTSPRSPLSEAQNSVEPYNKAPPVRRGRGRPAKKGNIVSAAPEPGIQSRRKRRNDNDDDDPDYNPTQEMQNTRATRTCSRKSFSDKSAEKAPTNEKMLTASTTVENESPPKVQTQKNVNSPLPEALSVAERLKLIAEKIADVMSKEPSPNIDIEAQKLLQTTQELLKLQKKALLQNSEHSSSISESPSGNVQIKQERIEMSENFSDDLPSNRLSEQTINHPAVQSNNGFITKQDAVDITQCSLSSMDIFNQLQTHQATLRKKLGVKGENVSNNVSLQSFSNTNLPVGIGISTQELSVDNPMVSSSYSVQNKCAFIMNYFTSYQEAFDEKMINEVIPMLSDIIMLCMEDLSECLKRTLNTKSFSSQIHRNQELQSTKEAYLKVVMSLDEKYFPWLNYVIDRITKVKASKALMVTFVLYITGSMSLKASKFRNQIHRVRRVMLFMSKAHGHYNPLIWQVLQASNDTFEEEMKVLIQLLQYFKTRRFVTVPLDKILNFPCGIPEEEQFQMEHSLIATTSFPDTFNQPDMQEFTGLGSQHELPPSVQATSSSSNINPSNKLSDVAVQFVEALQRERECSSKKIEEKLDNVLNVLSGNSELQSGSLVFSSEQPIGKNNTGVSSENNFYNNSPESLKVNLNKEVCLEKVRNTGLNSKQTPSLPDDRGTILAQLLENDHSGLDSLFESYRKSTKEKSVRIKTEPLEDNENYTESQPQNQMSGTNNKDTQSYFVNIKQEPGGEEDQHRALPFSSYQPWEAPSTSHEGSLSTDFNLYTNVQQDECEMDSFTEEPVSFPKTEIPDVDFDPFA